MGDFSMRLRKEKEIFMKRELRPRKKKSRALIIALLLAVSSGALIWNCKDRIAVLAKQYRAESEEEGIDFAYWMEINRDVCAWLKVPGTRIDYPVVQSITEADNYYLTHDIYQDENIYGAVFIEKSNLSDFTNPNTIIYGHHMTDGSMFGDLTKFEEREFFEEHQEFMVYLPGETRRYEITAAYRYPAEHLLSAFDFSTEEQTAKYCGLVPEFAVTYGGYAREGMELRAPFVTLSTCTSDNRSFRFLVQGRLADVKPRKEAVKLLERSEQ